MIDTNAGVCAVSRHIVIRRDARVERIRRIDPTHLQIDTVVDDPIMLLEPWRWHVTDERSTFGWFERECDSDRDGRDQEPDLTPPK